MTLPQTILVTGGAGYVGSHVVLTLLAAGRRVVVIDDLSSGSRALLPPDVALVVGRIGDAACLEALFTAHAIDAVVHCAALIDVAESVREPVRYQDGNVVQMQGLVDACVRHDVGSIVFTSTAAVYGETTEPMAETAPLAPINPYGETKVAGEAMLRAAAAAHGMSVGIIRCFNITGADPDLRSGQITAVPHHLIEVGVHVLMGDRAVLTIYGDDYPTRDGTPIRDYVHVSDVADAHLRLLDHVHGRGGTAIYNVGSGGGSSVREVVAALGAAAGRPVPVQYGPRRPGDPAVLLADAGAIARDLGWQPRHSDIGTIAGTAYRWEVRRRAMA